MRCLSLTQPYASLVAAGAKCVETRSWSTHYRGDVAIHAAQGFPAAYVSRCFREPFCSVLEAAGFAQPEHPELLSVAAIPRGVLLCVVTLRNCVRTEDVLPQLSEQERAFGNYQPGRWAWLLSDVRPLAAPIPARGALGLWTWEPKTAQEDHLINPCRAHYCAVCGVQLGWAAVREGNDGSVLCPEHVGTVA